ncbi:ImmA/IrrE family metallo-endopeptidase, partial [Haloferula sp.]|uniref:ImmA/IrrE family metallo-endopeptidase n=1 Tax=Haloferula sp. TaxID=2497595 RepID=UPI003C76CB6B
QALARQAELLERSDSLSEEERDVLDVMAVLIEKYESDHHPIQAPTPTEAILERMAEMNYKKKDLGKLLGSPSRVADILSGVRQLTPEMIRRLRDEWHIPADSLLGPGPKLDPDPDPLPTGRDFSRYDAKQMFKHGYFPWATGTWREWMKKGDTLLAQFFRGADAPQPVLKRQMAGSKSVVCTYALEAWGHRVQVLAAEMEPTLPPWNPQAVEDEAFLRWLAGLACLDEAGPPRAIEALRAKGISVVILPRLDHTHLDGAALLTPGGRPVIGLTLRHNRWDNFWFVLFHELGHVLRHLSGDTPAIYDSDLDSQRLGEVEQEADAFALDTLIPPEVWERVRHLQFAPELRRAAKQEHIGLSVLAGRLRRQANDFRLHRTLVGYNRLRESLGIKESEWPK